MIYHLIRMVLYGSIAGVISLVFCLVKHYERKRTIYITLFVAYIGALVGLELFKITVGSWRSYQLIPLVTVFDNISKGNTHYILQVLMSIIVFIPLGVFIRIRQNRISKAFIFGFMISLAMEVLQFALGVGTFDVDDIILNTLGTIIGFVLASKFVSTKRLQQT